MMSFGNFYFAMIFADLILTSALYIAVTLYNVYIFF